MRILVTGEPGVGKTTLVKRVAEKVPSCGFYTEEVRVNGRRIGFDAVRVSTGERVALSRVESGEPRVGRYRVYLENIETMMGWLEDCREGLLVVDEIGPMELKHPGFGPSVLRAVSRSKVFLGSVHRSIANRWRDILGAELFWLTRENREKVYREVLRTVTSLL